MDGWGGGRESSVFATVVCDAALTNSVRNRDPGIVYYCTTSYTELAFDIFKIL